MTTALDIVTRAHRLLGVSGQGEPLSAEMAAEGLAALNAMLHEWSARGVAYAHATLELADTMATPVALDRAVAHLLAADLAPVYLVAVPVDPDPFWRRVYAHYYAPAATVLPLPLRRMPSRRSSNYDVNEPETVIGPDTVIFG